MKKPFILLVALLSTLFASAQDCKYYDVLMQKANQLWVEGKFEQALNQLTAAREHCPSKAATVDAQFVAFTKKIAQKYREAEAEKRRAEQETQNAKNATARADRSALINRLGALALQKSKTDDYPLAWHLAVQAYQYAYDTLEGRCTELVVNGIMHDIISDSTRWLYQSIGRTNEKINSAVFSPDAQSILTYGDKTIDLWDKKGQLIKTIGRAVDQASFSPEGQLIVTLNRDGQVAHLLDSRGNLIKTIERAVDQASFSPDGQLILTRGDKTIDLWDNKGQLIKTIERAVDQASFSPDGQLIVTLNRDGQVAHLLDSRGNLIKTIERAGSNVDFSTGGQFVLFWDNKTAQLCDKTGQIIKIALEERENIKEASFYPVCPDDQHENQYLLITTYSPSDNNSWREGIESLSLWDQNGKLVKALTLSIANGKENPVNPVFSPDGKYRLTWEDNVAQLVDENGNVTKSMVPGSILAVAFFPVCPDDPKGDQFIGIFGSNSSSDFASLCDQTGKTIKMLSMWEHPDVPDFRFSTDFQICFSWFYCGGVTVQCPIIYKNGKVLKGMEDVYGMVFLPARHLFLALRDNQKAELWDKDLQRITSFEGVRAAVFSPPCPEDPLGGQYMLTTTGGEARLWSKNQQALKIFEGTDQTVFSPACVQDPSGGQFILTVGDGKARLWDKTGRAIKTLESEFIISKALFSPNGQRILTASKGVKQLWDHNGLLLKNLEGSGNSMLDAIFSPDGKRMLIHEGRPDRFNEFIATDLILYNENGDILNVISSSNVGKAFFSPDGKRILIQDTGNSGGSKIKKIQLWDENGRELGIIGPGKNPASAFFSPDGKYILTIYENHQAQLFDPNGLLLTTLSDTIQDAIFSPDGQFILSRFQRNVNLWDKKGHLIKILDPSPRFIEYAQSLQGKIIDPSPEFMEYAPDGRFFWLSYNFDPMSMDLSIAAFDKTGQPFHIFENNSKGYSYSGGGITFSPDGESILEFFGTTAKLWNKTGQKLKATIDNITGALFSPACPADPKGGQFILTWGADQTKLWDKSGQPLRTIYGPVENAKFSPDGQYIMTQAGKSWKLWEGLPLYIRNHFKLNAADLLRGGAALDEKLLLKKSTAPELVDIGELYYQQKDWANARLFYAAADQRQHSAEALIGLFKVARQTGQAFDVQRFLVSKDVVELQKYADYFVEFENGEQYKNKVSQAQLAVQLGEKMLVLNPNSAPKITVARYYDRLGYCQLFIPDAAAAEASLRRALALDPASLPIHLAHALLLQGRYAEAEKIYLEYKDKPYGYRDYKSYFLQEFQELENQGVSHPDIARIRARLKGSGE